MHGKNDFTEGSEILLDTDLNIILLDHQNNFVRSLRIMNNDAINFDILHSEKKIVSATRNLRTNNASTMYYKVVITTMNK